MTVRVLIVDDSPLIREMLTAILSADPGIRVVGTAADPYEARERIRELAPDVITLDVEMPNMNGIAFLERLMRLKPTPVVMVSTLTKKGADVTLLALELGAVDFVAKPTDAGPGALERIAQELRQKVTAAAQARPGTRAPATAPAPAAPASVRAGAVDPRALVAIGASTGGVEAIREVLRALPAGLPPIVITQHMPAGFTQRFAQRLDEATAHHVVEATEGYRLSPGDVAIAPGNRHLRVKAAPGGYTCVLSDEECVSGHRPSVDVLLRSVAQAAGRHAVGVILTGMGRDGAQGLLAMRQAGAHTIGQNEASALVYGMPRVAREVGAVETEAALGAIPRLLLDRIALAAKAA